MRQCSISGQRAATALFGCLIALPTAATMGDELFKLVPSDSSDLREFGLDVASDGNLAIVGATGDYFQRPRKSGAAFLYDVTSGQEIRKLTVPQNSGSDLFGRSVDLAGNVAVVGSPEENSVGAAYVFNAATGEQIHKLIAANPAPRDLFGSSVAVSENVILIGAPTTDRTGFVTVFDATTGEKLREFHPSDSPQWAKFGDSVAIDGDLAIVGAPYDGHAGYGAGSAYVFDLRTGAELMKLTSSDPREQQLFGVDVAIEGHTALVGASGDGCCNPGGAYLFDLITGAQFMKLSSNVDPYFDPPNLFYDRFGRSVALHDRFALVGAPSDNEHARQSGAMYLYDATSGALLHKFKVNGAEAFEWFGWSVALNEGVILEANSPQDAFGRAYVFRFVPEPSIAALLGPGMLILLVALRQRSSAAIR